MSTGAQTSAIPTPATELGVSHQPPPSSTERVVLEGGLTVYEALALKEQLLATLDRGHGLELDLSGIAEIDGAGLQLLLAARREARQRGLRFAVDAPSSAAREAFELVGWQAEGAPARCEGSAA